VELGAGSRSVVVDVATPGGGRWDVTLVVDGEPASSGELVQLSRFLPYEGIDVGIDRRSPVSWELYQRRRSFRFTGRLRSVTYVPGEPAPDAGQRAIEEALKLGLGLE
jgi:arylsulfatase